MTKKETITQQAFLKLSSEKKVIFVFHELISNGGQVKNKDICLRWKKKRVHINPNIISRVLYKINISCPEYFKKSSEGKANVYRMIKDISFEAICQKIKDVYKINLKKLKRKGCQRKVIQAGKNKEIEGIVFNLKEGDFKIPLYGLTVFGNKKVTLKACCHICERDDIKTIENFVGIFSSSKENGKIILETEANEFVLIILDGKLTIEYKKK